MKKNVKILFKINLVKLTAVFVINCFLFSFVYGNVIAEVSAGIRAGVNDARIFNDLILPYSYGKITQTNITDSPRIVIQIQDLHCHPQAQRNISDIIELVDKKLNNGLNTIYLEGAFGSVDTSWLGSSDQQRAKSENNENTVLEKILSTGRLTGAEYYSALTGKYNIIKGLESKEEYLDNVKRFGDILERQGEVLEILNGIEESTQGLKERYYNRKQSKIENLFKSYSKQEISANKYYALLFKHSDRLGIDINKYENIHLYTAMIQEEKQLNYEQVNKELQGYIYILKEKLPYGSYKAILDATNNFSRTDKLYEYLISLSREFNIDVNANFPELNKFFTYVETGQKINPIGLVNEEQRLRNEINSRFSDTKTQREVVFLIDFEKYLKDYLTAKITSGDYAYYKENIEKYRKLWVKHVDNRVLSLLDGYITEADRFYAINVDRNKYFMRQLQIANSETKDMPLKRIAAVVGEQNTADLNSSLSGLINDRENKQVDIVVTGGFHTEGVSKILKENNISYVVITPNVTESVKGAEELYRKIAKLQSKQLQNSDREMRNKNSEELSFIAESDGGSAIRKSALANMIVTLSPAEQAELFKELGVSPKRINELYGDIKMSEPVLSDTAEKAREIVKLVKAAKLLESDDNDEIIDGVIKTIKENLPENSSFKDKITAELVENLDLEKVKDALEGKIKKLESLLKIAEIRLNSSSGISYQTSLTENILGEMKTFAEELVTKTPRLTMAWLKRVFEKFNFSEERQNKWIKKIETPLMVLGIWIPPVQKIFLFLHKKEDRADLKEALSGKDGINDLTKQAFKEAKSKITFPVIKQIADFAVKIRAAFKANSALHIAYNEKGPDVTDHGRGLKNAGEKAKKELPGDIEKASVKPAKIILAASIILNILLAGMIVILTSSNIFLAVFPFVFSMYPIHFLVSNVWALLSKEIRHTISGRIKKNNSNYANIIREYEITDDSPSATIQVPIYTEDNETIFKTLRQSLAAVENYRSKANVRANLLVSDDGLQLWLDDGLSEETVDELLRKNADELTEKENLAVERIRFYRDNNIAFVARPKGNRSGRFKKGSNLNNTLNLAERIESGELFGDLTSPEGDFYGTYAEGDIVVNDLILLLDKDSGLHPEVISATVGEFALDPSLAYTQHQTVPENNEETYFSKITGYFTNVLNSIAMPTNALQGQMVSFVGHNGFLRKSFLRESAYPKSAGGSYKLYWAEDRVSEDYAKAMDAYSLGYHGKYIAYEGLYFTEQVSRTFLEEAGKYCRYSYGIFEIMFNDMKNIKKGLFNDTFKKYVGAQIKNERLFDVANLFIYMFSYVSLALILPSAVISVFLLQMYNFGIAVPLIMFIFTTLRMINLMISNKKTGANLTYKVKDSFIGIVGTGLVFIGLSYPIINGFFKFFYDSLSEKPKAFPATNIDSLDYNNFKAGAKSIWDYYKSNPLYAAVIAFLFAEAVAIPFILPATLLNFGLFFTVLIIPFSLLIFTPQLVLPIVNQIKRAFKAAADKDIAAEQERAEAQMQAGAAAMHAVRAANPGAGVPVSQKIAVQIVSSRAIAENLERKDLSVENSLVIVNDIGQAQTLQSQGFNAGTASVMQQKPKAGDGWRKVKTTISKDGAKISVYVKNENGVKKITFYSKAGQVDLESAKELLKELFSDGIIDKTFKNVKQIIVTNDITAGSVIDMMKNNHTYSVEENVNERVYDMSDKGTVGNFETACRQEFRSNYVGIFVLSQSQAIENKTSVEKLRKEGMRFEIKIQSQSFDINLLEGLDGCEIDASEIESAAEAENLLRQIQKARLSVKDGIYSRISVRFNGDVTKELDGTADVWKKYSILPVVNYDSGYRSYAQISFPKDADLTKVAEALRKENTAAVSVEDTMIFAEIKEVIIETKKSVSFKQRYKKGYTASLNSKFDYTSDDIKALEELLTGDLTDNEKAKTAVENMSEAGLSADSKAYLHYLADKGQYVEAVGFIRGVAANSIRKEIFKTLEKYNVYLDMEKFQKDDKFRRAFLTLALQLKLGGHDIKELLRDDVLSSADPDMKAAEYFDLLAVRINKAIEDVLAENEYSVKILANEKAVVAVDMFKDFNVLLQDKFGIREITKQLKVPTTLAVRSILSAA